MSNRMEIELIGEHLSEGESSYETCPSCNRKGKFSVTRTDEGSLLYHCFRNSCILHRGGAIGGTRSSGIPRAVKTARAKFTHPTRSCTREERLFLLAKLGWKWDHLLAGLPQYCDGLQRYAFPIIDPYQERRGWVLRTWDGREPKALTYMDGDGPRLSHYEADLRGCKVVIVCEDIPSAVRASVYANAVSLQGTSCNTDDALEMAECYDHVIWCLDADAFTQGLRLQREHSFLFKKSDVLCPRVDLKDMLEPELKQLLGNL